MIWPPPFQQLLSEVKRGLNCHQPHGLCSGKSNGEKFLLEPVPFSIKLPGNWTYQVVSEVYTHNTKFIMHIMQYEIQNTKQKYLEVPFFLKLSGNQTCQLISATVLLGIKLQLPSSVLSIFHEAEIVWLFCFPCTEKERESLQRSWLLL